MSVERKKCLFMKIIRQISSKQICDECGKFTHLLNLNQPNGHQSLFLLIIHANK